MIIYTMHKDNHKNNDTRIHGAEHLQQIVHKLRGKNGCPWDIRQTPISLKKYLLEETRELAEAIESDDPQHVCEEIGDVYFILTLLTLLYEEQGDFEAEQTWKGIIEKMIRRHPHVFGTAEVTSEKELREQWEEIKCAEKKGTNNA